MLPYSRMHKRDSVLNKNRITFHIPGGSSTSKADWYPFVITFNDNRGLSSYLGESVEFTVLYSFGHFPAQGRHMPPITTPNHPTTAASTAVTL